MATTKKQATPRGWRSLTLTVGLVSMPVQIGTAFESHTPGGNMVCREHDHQVNQAWYCKEGDHYMPKADTKSVYKVDGGYVEVDAKQLEVKGDGNVVLTACTEHESIDPVYIDSRYLIWPQADAPAAAIKAFDLFTKVLRDTGQALVGTVVLTKSTRAFVVRWSKALEAPVAETLTYDANVKHDAVKLVRDAAAERGQATKEELAMAETLLATLADSFDPAAMHDEYAEALTAAIDAAARGEVIATPEAEAEVAPVIDLMDALQASVDAAAKPAKKPAAKRKKVAA